MPVENDIENIKRDLSALTAILSKKEDTASVANLRERIGTIEQAQSEKMQAYDYKGEMGGAKTDLALLNSAGAATKMEATGLAVNASAFKLDFGIDIMDELEKRRLRLLQLDPEGLAQRSRDAHSLAGMAFDMAQDAKKVVDDLRTVARSAAASTGNLTTTMTELINVLRTT
ncbi:hypothetical protein OG948_12290 [Embleya sp. NBC_00888]|uniref:hypothetical protein n=1 Tax=Embleya sp. NBC_00888 TaxID=2975960 RepID=UPI00386930D8|nr:hypothetical protein OG948_12290 [Embleya sp. NBC_00888]